VTAQLSFKVDLPSDWFAFEPASQDDEAFVAGAVANLHQSLRESGYGHQMVSLERLESTVRKMFTQLSRENVRLAGVCVKRVRVRDVDTAVSVSMTAAVRPMEGSLTSKDARAVLKEVATLSGPLYAHAAYDESLLTMSGSDVLRMSWRGSQRSPWTGESQSCRILQFVLPLVDAGTIVVLTFQTASEEFYDEMAAVFEGIAATLEATPSGGGS
jgi:hypothetical protein